jgi:ABC-type multidrug transport system ATPase subunit
MRGRTVIAIAHRLATLRNFDRVVMLKAGKIIEDGSPDRLMQGRGPIPRTGDAGNETPCNTRDLNYRASRVGVKWLALPPAKFTSRLC